MSNIRIQKVGRPTVINEDIVRKLECALASGFNISFACNYAGISTSTFYEHKADDMEFAYRVRTAEDWATLRARQIVLQAIDNGDVATAKWYLSCKARAEFSPSKAM